MRFTLLRLMGIPVRVHLSFVLLASIALLWGALRGGPAMALYTGLLGLLVFGSVVLHELGHATMARGFGIRTRDITLYPFGGIAAIAPGKAGVPAVLNPVAEFCVALAGPAVNFVLVGAGILLTLVGLGVGRDLAAVNLVLGLFNLVPAYPMDGGRLLRAVLTPRQGWERATRTSLDVSRIFAWLFIVVGLFGPPTLVLVGAVLLVMQGIERRNLELSARLVRMGFGRQASTSDLFERLHVAREPVARFPAPGLHQPMFRHPVH